MDEYLVTARIQMLKVYKEKGQCYAISFYLQSLFYLISEGRIWKKKKS